MSTVLVTGSAGAVGQAVCAELGRRGHTVRGLDLRPTEGLADAVIGSVADAAAVATAIVGCDAVIHLAAERDDAPFLETLLEPNVVGLFTVMNAARAVAARRVVLASSVQVVGLKPRNLPPRFTVTEQCPENHYALTKLWAEQLGAMYARCYAMSVIAVRLGWMVRNPREAAVMSRLQRQDIYLSRAEAGRFFALAVEATGVSFEVLYAMSAVGAERYDMEPARRWLGFEPRDRWPEGLGFALPESSQS